MVTIIWTKHDISMKGKLYKDMIEFMTVLDKKLQHNSVRDLGNNLYTAETYIENGYIEYGLLSK